MTVWPSGLRRWLQAPVRKGVGSNPTAVIYKFRISAAAQMLLVLSHIPDADTLLYADEQSCKVSHERT